jgi:hypothetical protein
MPSWLHDRTVRLQIFQVRPPVSAAVGQRFAPPKACPRSPVRVGNESEHRVSCCPAGAHRADMKTARRRGPRAPSVKDLTL